MAQVWKLTPLDLAVFHEAQPVLYVKEQVITNVTNAAKEIAQIYAQVLTTGSIMELTIVTPVIGIVQLVARKQIVRIVLPEQQAMYGMLQMPIPV